MDFQDLSDGVVDEDRSDQRSKAILSEASDVLDQEAQIEHHEDEEENEDPNADPQAEFKEIHLEISAETSITPKTNLTCTCAREFARESAWDRWPR